MEDSQALPSFRYHPDPLATGGVKTAPDRVRAVCNRIRWFIYHVPAYTAENFLDDALCPWCIADGAAARKFNAAFNDVGIMDGVRAPVMDEMENHTPGVPWMKAGDLAHLPAGVKQPESDFPDAIPALRNICKSTTAWPPPTNFRGLHCRRYLAYADHL